MSDDLKARIKFEAVNSEINRKLAGEIIARITALEAERDDWMKVVGQIAGAVPLPRVVSVTGSVEDLIDYFKGLQAERDRLREALEDIADGLGETDRTVCASSRPRHRGRIAHDV